MSYQLSKDLKTKQDFLKAGLTPADLALIDYEKQSGSFADTLNAIANYKITTTKAAISAPVVKLLKEKGVDCGGGTVASAKETLSSLFAEHPSLRHEDPGLALLKIVYWTKHAEFQQP